MRNQNLNIHHYLQELKDYYLHQKQARILLTFWKELRKRSAAKMKVTDHNVFVSTIFIHKIQTNQNMSFHIEKQHVQSLGAFSKFSATSFDGRGYFVNAF